MRGRGDGDTDRLPDFLVIGAQKCGTTTLFEDLRSHPAIRLAEKESSILLGGRKTRNPDPNASVPDLRRRYSAALPRRAAGGVLGEVATTYTMLPENSGVVPNAASVVPDAKIIYIIREPVSRVVSHHHHDFALGLTGPDINTAVYDHPPLIDNTRYATQLKPWLGAYGHDSVLVLRFEDYVRNRQCGAASVFEFLGVPPFRLPDTAVIHNSAETKHVAVGPLGRLADSDIYRNRIRPLISGRMRRMMSGNLLPKAPPRPDPPSPDTVAYVIEQLQPEVDELADLLGTERWWDLAEVARLWQRSASEPR